MSNIDKQWLQQKITEMEEHRDFFPGDLDDDHASVLSAFRIALASLEAEKGVEPVAKVETVGVCWYADNGVPRKPAVGTELFSAPPAPVSVPDEMTSKQASRSYCGEVRGYRDGWNACRAAMLQGAVGNSPAIPDDVRRMDWLVSKTVDVREPMVYGSHSLFWSQTITDEEDDYHATKLREQIDAAMASENAAAPQQEVKP